MPAFVFALLSYFGWGTGDIFGAIAARKIGAYAATLWIFIFGIILFSFYIPFATKELLMLTGPLLLLNLGLGFFFVSGNIAINESLVRSNPSLALTIIGGFPALVVIFSLLFLGEHISSLQFLVILIIFLGVFLCTLDLRMFKKKQRVDKGIIFALYAMVSLAIYFTFIKGIIREIGWFWPNFISFFWFPMIYFIMKWKQMKIENPIKTKSLIAIGASTFLLRMGDFAFNLGISSGFTTLVAPIAGAYPTLSVILGFKVFKEPISMQQRIGIIVSLTGIVLLGLISI
ncbi:MAG: DMT family transporter [Candidatus Gottesmanbacteria bacterium]|nr:DMT family transporter [Candidatus Gottesmanbacteria bacterium]